MKSDKIEAQISVDRILEFCKMKDVYTRYGINTWSEPVVALRNDINTAIDGEELLSRLRPRIKSLFK